MPSTQKTVAHRILNPSGQDCLALAATLAAGSIAYGDAIRFDNDGSFGWYFTTLDLTKPAADQDYGGPDDVTGTSAYVHEFGDYYYDYYYSFSYNHIYTLGQGAELSGSGWRDNYTAPFNAGEPIGPGLSGGAWGQYKTLEFAWNSWSYYGGSDSGFRGLLPPDNSPTYIGARLTIDNQLHYGWIGLRSQGWSISVFAWGYETEPGVAIGAGVPAPGGMAVLALGAVGALGRKRRA